MGKKRHRWTEEENRFLIENYSLLGPTKVVDELYERFGTNVTSTAVKAHASELRKDKTSDIPHICPDKIRWLPEEDCLIVNNYTLCSAKEISEMLFSQFGTKRAVTSVISRARVLNVQRKCKKITPGDWWSPEEEQYLLENFDSLDYSEMAEKLNELFGTNRSSLGVSKKLYSLRKNGSVSLRPKQPHTSWTKEKDDYLIKNFLSKSCEEIANDLNELYHGSITVNAVQNRAKSLRNKYGTNYVPHKLVRHHEIGDIATWMRDETKIKEQYIRIGPGKHDWIPLKRYIMGEKADGKCVIFLNGNTEDPRFENLACVSSSVNTRLTRHGLRSKDPEITKAAIKWCELAEALENQNEKEK